jgi:ferredoxin
MRVEIEREECIACGACSLDCPGCSRKTRRMVRAGSSRHIGSTAILL